MHHDADVTTSVREETRGRRSPEDLRITTIVGQESRCYTQADEVASARLCVLHLGYHRTGD